MSSDRHSFLVIKFLAYFTLSKLYTDEDGIQLEDFLLVQADKSWYIYYLYSKFPGVIFLHFIAVDETLQAMLNTAYLL